jgi:phage conserved hypothetical protein, phiE125 gp8 family
VTQTWRLTLDYFPGVGYGFPEFHYRTWNYEAWPLFGDIIRLPRPPLQSVTSVKYLDAAGVLQTLDPTKYQLDLDREPARIRPAPGTLWPTTYLGYFGMALAPVQITYVAGYGAAAAVPDTIKAALKMHVAQLYEYREAVSDRPLTAVPMAVESLLATVETGEYY